ncbi:MAG: hypothetical protein HBSIN02_16070 [Bacteroidia bacterium]|nr:MAG: hypothetical protein HBSIN02_16070 [Bacteroidia bacterium]
MRKTIRYIALLVLILSSSAGADTLLRLQKGTSSGVDVVLKNDREIAALQFTIRGEGVLLGEILPSGRMTAPQWQMSFHRVDEYTINVVILRTGTHSLPEGEGIIASLTGLSGRGTLVLSRVVIADPEARSVAVTLENLEWYDETGASVALGQNYPNPFNPTTTIPYVLDRASTVRLVVYDITGREVKKVVDEQKEAGSYAAIWDGTDDTGLHVPSGVYFAKVEAGMEVKTRKMVLAR